MFMDFSGTAIRDDRSFLNDRIGQKLFGDNITIYDDARHPLQSGAAFDAEGVPRRRLTLVDAGVVREIAYCRQAAALAGVAPTGHGFPLPNEMGEAPMNIVIAGGDTSVDEMMASTERGILVTRLWYIREVDPYEKIFTGMTRDGTFLVEGGKVTARRAQFPLQRGTDGDAVERRSALARGARVRRGDVRHGGARDEGARLQLHGSDAVLRSQTQSESERLFACRADPCSIDPKRPSGRSPHAFPKATSCPQRQNPTSFRVVRHSFRTAARKPPTWGEGGTMP